MKVIIITRTMTNTTATKIMIIPVLLILLLIIQISIMIIIRVGSFFCSYETDIRSDHSTPKSRISFENDLQFESMLTQLADHVPDRNLRYLSEALGFHEVETQRFKESNRKGDCVTTEGTRHMLQAWLMKTLQDDRVAQLEAALKRANLHQLVEKYLWE